MTQNSRDAGSSGSIRITSDDADAAERLNLASSPSTAYSEALEDAKRLDEIATKAKKIRQKMNERPERFSIGDLLKLLEMIPEPRGETQ